MRDTEPSHSHQPESHFKTTGVLVDFFSRIEQSKKGGETALPDTIPTVVKSESDCQALFDIALKAWEENFDLEKLKKAISQLRQKNAPEELKCQILKYFFEVRRVGKIIRTAFTSLDITHTQLPEPYHQLLKEFGKVRDSATIKNDLEMNEALAHLDTILNNHANPTEVFSHFQPADTKSFMADFNHRLEILKRLLSQEKITAKDLHNIRKYGIKYILNLFVLLSLQTNSEDARNTHLWLRQIDNYLGDINDSVVRGEIQEDSLQQVDSEIKQMIQEFINKIRNTSQITVETIQ